MHAIHIIAGLRATDGGPTYSVPRLCKALGELGAKVDLMAVSEGSAQEFSNGNYCERRFIWDYVDMPVLSAIRASSALTRTLCREARVADVIHNHGLWLMPNVYAGREAHRAQRPLIVAPRGMLGPAALTFSRLKKQAFWHLLQKSAVAAAACFHATSEQEYDEIRAFGLRNPVAVIPNGIDVDDAGVLETRGQTARTVLSLGRIHPKKGLDVLLRAWARVESTHPDWRLRIVGPSENGYGSALKVLANSLELTHVSIEDALYGADKARAYRDAELFVLPTLNDNFALTVAESLAARVPVIATRGAPWKGLVDEGCGWWIDHGIEPLTAALSQSMAMSQQHLAAMGERGRAWMIRDYSWQRVAGDMIELYRWLAASAPRPSFVQIQ